LLVQEQQRAQGLVLRAGRNVPVRCQIGQELLDFATAHVARMASLVELNEADDPFDVALLGT
jgi:hypothetical protein